jgi:hypothetical protein
MILLIVMTINSDIALLVAITVLLIFSSQRFARLRLTSWRSVCIRRRKATDRSPVGKRRKTSGNQHSANFPPVIGFPFHVADLPRILLGYMSVPLLSISFRTTFLLLDIDLPFSQMVTSSNKSFTALREQ